jgi:hypothetical protein
MDNLEHIADDFRPVIRRRLATIGATSACRRRFLLEKHPHLAEQDTPGSFPDVVPDDADEAISVLGELAEAGGSNLH